MASQALDSVPAQVTDATYPSRATAWYATLLFAFLYWLSVLDRFVISLMVEPIKRDLGLTDLQFGMLHGFAFAATFSLFGLLCGALVDRASRRWIIFAGVSVWSLATAACGMAQNYVHLLLARIGVGAGEAALNPSATSMLADLFPPQRLTLAMAVYAMGSTIGAGTSFLVGGAIVSLVSQSDMFALPFIGEVRSWQAVFFIVGIPGVLLSFAIFTIPEPARRGVLVNAPTRRTWLGSYRDFFQFMKTRPRFFTMHYVGFCFASAVVTGGLGWFPVHMTRAFGWSSAQIGLNLGLVVVAAAVIGKSIAGRVMDLMYQRGYRDAQLRWYAGCLLVAVPVSLYTMTNPNPWIFLGGVGLSLMLLQPLPVCAFTSLNLVTPNNLRGTGIAVFGASSGLIGASIGPMLIPLAAGSLFEGNFAIGYGAAAVAAVCCPIASLFVMLTCRPMREAMAQIERATAT